MFPKKMGISVYIGKQSLEKDIEYLKLAKKYGFSRVFSCFLHVNEDTRDKFLSDFKIFMDNAKKLGFEVFIDVNPILLKILGLTYDNLKTIEDLGVTGIRLDEGFSGLEESLISYSGALNLEINASNGTKFFDNLMSFEPCVPNVVACHNFYPRRYTGLSLEHFKKSSELVKKHGLRLAAFVTSQAEGTFFSQDILQNLPTLEHHRDWDILTQAKELYYCGLIDDVIISNAYATEEELKRISDLDKNIMTLDIILEKGVSDLDKEMILDNLHMNRGDASDYVIRSTLLRIKYKNENIKPFNTLPIKKGDITIDNNEYKKYKGELHIARKDMLNDGNVNIVAKIVEHDLFLLDYIKPWTKFKFRLLD